MKIIKLSITVLVLISYTACSQNNSLQHVDFLIGTWKKEGKESYESWVKKDDKFQGQSYKIKDGQKFVSENIEVTLVGDQIMYTPTVFNQNDGKGIPFTLKSLEENLFSFENPKHDFPKKIQYKILNSNELYVSVLGEKDKGFSYKLMKQLD